MVDLMKFPNAVLFRDLNFRRYSEGWELESFYSLMSRIYGLLWEELGMIRCVGNLLCEEVLLFVLITRFWQKVSISLSLGRLFGSLRSLLELLFFVWISALGNILTIDNLRKQKILILDWCCMCKRNEVSVDHLLIHCPIAFDLWSMVFTLFGIHWVILKIVVELLAC